MTTHARTPTRPTRRAGAPQRLMVALTLALAGALAGTLAPPAHATTDERRFWPVPGPVVRMFDPPAQPWLSGHRGIDIAAPAGTSVVAAAAGTVTWVGVIDSVPMLTVTHADGLRTTYQPVRATLRTGTSVSAGQVVGLLRAGHAAQDCLHLGLLRGQVYLDPMAWLTSPVAAAPVRLLPDGLTLAAMPPGATSGLFTTPAGGWPVRGPITSPYGWRNDPFTGVRSFHSGTDIGAPCGTPVVTTIAGTVAVVATDPARGNYIVIDHGSGLRTLYAHLSRQLTVVGRHVGSGQVIGLVGTTGRSTGCHLHFEAAQNGATFDSRRLLP